MNAVSQNAQSSIETIESALEHYANRGVFRGFGRGPQKQGKPTFKIVWHHDKLYELIFDPKKTTLRFPILLPSVPADSDMYRAFKEYVKARLSDSLPEHRRIDKNKVGVRPYNRGGNISLSLKIKDNDLEYGVRKLVHLVHEIFLDFLSSGLYYDYLVEHFDVDPDPM